MAPDLKAALEAALTKPIKIKQGDLERTVSMATAGIEQLVALYAKGDRHARRDLIHWADKLGVDLIAGQSKAMQEALVANHQAILDSYVAPEIREGFCLGSGVRPARTSRRRSRRTKQSSEKEGRIAQ